MIRQGKAWTAMFAALNLVLSAAAANNPNERSIAEGQELAANRRDRTPPENLEVNGLLKIRGRDGKRTKVSIRYRVVVSDEHWESIYETRPTDASEPERLVVRHTDGAPNRYFRSGPARPGQPVPLSGEAAMVPFANSDFWSSDLGLEFLHWPQQRIVEE